MAVFYANKASLGQWSATKIAGFAQEIYEFFSTGGGLLEVHRTSSRFVESAWIRLIGIFRIVGYFADMPLPIITLTTDFGLGDSYVAEMKAAILLQCETARLVDVTHLVPAHDILFGSIMLERALAAFPLDTIHLAVIDPGVGTARRLLIARLHNQTILCPDNGLITWPWRRFGAGNIFEITWRPTHISPTFHGRDILGPAAGLLASGTPITDLATPIENPVLLDMHLAPAGAKSGKIIHIDHFGNAMTNIPRELLPSIPGSSRSPQPQVESHPPGSHPPANCSVIIGQTNLGAVRQTYQDVSSGDALALIGSAGLLEIAIRDGSAAKVLNLRVGDLVSIESRA
jgi:S-adenosylmethionine hydrolase